MNNIENIIKQFKNAQNIKSNDTKSRIFKDELLDWLTERKSSEMQYLDFLYSLGTKINDFHTAEVGKGELDSILDKNSTSTIITRKRENFTIDDPKNNNPRPAHCY